LTGRRRDATFLSKGNDMSMLPDDGAATPATIDAQRLVRRVGKAAILIVAAYFVLKVVIVVFALAISLLASVALVLLMCAVVGGVYLAVRRRRQ